MSRRDDAVPKDDAGGKSSADSIKVVRGRPDESELIAVIASVTAITAADDEDQEPGSPTSAWMDRSRTMRGRRQGVLARGPMAWRHSLR